MEITVAVSMYAANTYRRYDVRSGLSDISVKDICQDARGYMWFATKDGLNRFDGYGFQVFGSSDTGQTHNIESICPHSDGRRIWIAATRGLAIFDPDTERITDFDVTGCDGTLNPNCQYLEYDSRGDLWIASQNGVIRYGQNTGNISSFVVPDVSSQIVRVVFEDLSSDIWAGTSEGLSFYDEQNDCFTPPVKLHTSGASAGDNEITAVCVASRDNIYVGTQNGEFALFDTKTRKYTIFSPENASGEKYDLSRIHTIYIQSQEDCMVGSDSGMFHFNSRTGIWTRSEDELSRESIYKFFVDREGSLWIGTYFLGVCYVSQKQNEIEWYCDNGQKWSLKGNAVSQFCEDSDGNMWIATENGGLNFLDTATGRITDYSEKSHYNIHALCLDDNALWIGTFSCGLDRMDLVTGDVKRYKNIPGDDTSLCSDYVYSIFKADDRYLYVGTLNGLCVLDKSSGLFSKIPEIGNHFINDIAADGAGNIWLADKNSGIWKKSSYDGSWINYRHSDSDPYSPVGDRITRVYVDNAGTVWFCEEGKGICRYVEDMDGFENFTEKDNLPSSIYYGILEDDTGYYWISSNSGIIRYNPVLKTSTRYTYEDGLQSNQFNFRSSYRSGDGIMYFGGINGFNSFSPFNLSVNTVRPQTVISSVKIYSSGTSHDGEVCRIIPDGSVRMTHKTVTFDVNFECLSFVAPGQNLYQWTMKGAYKDWITTNRHSVSFMKLPAGHYTFLVRGCNNDGYWSDKPASLSIRIVPHPLLSSVAMAVYAIVILLVFYAAVRTIISRQKEKKEQELVAAKMNFFTQVAHEIKTPVSLIKAPLEKVMENGRWDSDTESNLDIMQKNVDRLQTLIRQLLDFRKIDKNGYTLSLGKTDLIQMTGNIVERFRPSDSAIDLVMISPHQHIMCYIDNEAITKVISNLLANAFKYARKKIKVSIDIVGDRIIISVKDDGPGIPSGLEDKIFEPFYQADPYSGNGFGIGLSLVRLLVEKHGGKVSLCMDKGETGCRIVVDIPYVPNMEKSQDGNSEILLGAVEKEDAASGDDDARQGHCILVVEDNPDMLQFLVKIFEDTYKVLAASDGETAADVLDRCSCDLIISDIMMPGLDGFGLLQKVREDEMLRHIPVILLSAQDSLDSKIAGLEYGADAFIEKPFSVNHIKATVRNLIENRRILFEQFASYPNLFFETDGMDEKDRKWLERLNEIIKHNLANDKFSVDVLCSEMAICRTNLQKKLKGLTGSSPNEYIKLVRLKLAANLLKEGKYRINEVCYICGFNNTSYFTKCFHRQFGILPKDYINSPL